MSDPLSTPPLNTPEARRAGAILTIDLDALVSNWKTCAAQAPNAETAAVVKAAAYGTDASKSAKALQKAGCKTFFVASVQEGIDLRAVLGPAPAVHIFNGLMNGAERDYTEFNLTPVLNSLGEVEAWGAYGTGLGEPQSCDIHFDTGMARLGLPQDEAAKLLSNPEHLSHIKLDMILSHLVSAEDADNPLNAEQLSRFQGLTSQFPSARGAFANSSGIFLGADYHFDVTRPGVSLYGANPTPNKPNPMAQVVRLQGKILQVRTIDTPQTVGYGATHQALGEERIATVSVGYADGYLRSLSSSGVAYIGDQAVPVVGRVSMDLIGLDVSAVPEELCRPGMLVDLIGPHNPVDHVAERAGTIGYEILTSLGARYHRIYLGG
ncbi:alanine racemase [Magnetovibrio sp. PR-2]|uniref:alanine racemase n=1 Tax=Magnetovibrio sp. PR-2 TaxID=3120356 RepID=UPI002FCE5711